MRRYIKDLQKKKKTTNQTSSTSMSSENYIRLWSSERMEKGCKIQRYFSAKLWHPEDPPIPFGSPKTRGGAYYFMWSGKICLRNFLPNPQFSRVKRRGGNNIQNTTGIINDEISWNICAYGLQYGRPEFYSTCKCGMHIQVWYNNMNSPLQW